MQADPHPLGTFAITGPAPVTVREHTEILAELLGRGLRVEEITEDEARAGLAPPETPGIAGQSVLETMSGERKTGTYGRRY